MFLRESYRTEYSVQKHAPTTQCKAAVIKVCGPLCYCYTHISLYGDIYRQGSLNYAVAN